MDWWMDVKFHTYTHKQTNIMKPCWEWCVSLHISMQPRATIIINQAGFDVQALSPCDCLSALSHNNLDGYHSRRLIEQGRVIVWELSVFGYCMFPSVFECAFMCVCVDVFVLWAEIVARLWCHCRIAQWSWCFQHQRLETKSSGWNSLFITAYHCFT